MFVIISQLRCFLTKKKKLNVPQNVYIMKKGLKKESITHVLPGKSCVSLIQLKKPEFTYFFRDESNASLNAPKHSAEAFNEHFLDIGYKLSVKIQVKTFFKSFLKGRNPISMALFSPTFVEIYNAIHSLNNKKSSKVDTIPSYFLKVASLVITPYLMHLFKVCFKNG